MKFSLLLMLISDEFRLKVRKITKKGYLGFLLMFIKTDKFSIKITIQSLDSILNNCFLKKIQRYAEE